MNTFENFAEKARKEAFQFGFLMDYIGYWIGYQEGAEENVRNLIKQSILTDEQIASAMNVTMDYIAEIRNTLTLNK